MGFFSKLFSRKKQPQEVEEKLSAEKEAVAPVAEEEPAPAKEEAPAPAKEETPAPAKEEAPAPAKEEAPAPAKEEAPAPAKEETPAPAKEEAPAPAKEEAPAPAKEETPASAKEEAPAPAKEEAPAPAKEETPAPAKEEAPAPAKEEAPAERPRVMVVRQQPKRKKEEPASPAPETPAGEPHVIGKYEFELAPDGYRFNLIANNGQLLYESVGFSSLEGALTGIDTFRRAVANGNFTVLGDKYDRYRFVLNRKYYGENYSTRAQCEKCVESVRRFASGAVVVPYEPSEEKLAAFAAAKATRRRPEDVDWDAVAQQEAVAEKLGKFEIVRGEDREFRFYLVANNGQILYTGKNYEKLCQCQAGIQSFKRAVYVGNFSVDEDKFGRFRYILRNIGVAPAFMGESYTTRAACESAIESVKRFVVTAEICLPEAPAEEG